MAIVVERLRDVQTGRFTQGDDTVRDEYLVTGAADMITAINASGVPTYGDLFPGSSSLKVETRDIAVEDGSEEMWRITIGYKYSASKSTFPDDPVDGDEFWTYGANLQGFNAKQALAQDAATDSKDIGNLIGMKDDGSVEGMQWSDAVPTLSITRWKAASGIDDAFINGIENAVGDVNSAVYYGRAIGEMRLMSATIPNQGETLWELNFQFEVKKNTDLADMPEYKKWSDGTTYAYPRGKYGWEYAHVLEKERTAIIPPKTVPEKIIAAQGLYIARRFEWNTFAALGLNGYLFAP